MNKTKQINVEKQKKLTFFRIKTMERSLQGVKNYNHFIKRFQ